MSLAIKCLLIVAALAVVLGGMIYYDIRQLKGRKDD